MWFFLRFKIFFKMFDIIHFISEFNQQVHFSFFFFFCIKNFKNFCNSFILATWPGPNENNNFWGYTCTSSLPLTPSNTSNNLSWESTVGHWLKESRKISASLLSNCWNIKIQHLSSSCLCFTSYFFNYLFFIQNGK